MNRSNRRNVMNIYKNVNNKEMYKLYATIFHLLDWQVQKEGDIQFNRGV